MQIISITEAKASLSKLLEKVQKGEDVIIGKAGKPIAKLIPYKLDNSPRDMTVRIWQGEVWMADDFDELPEDIMEYFIAEKQTDELTS